jgi:2-isopropylmalate synthase
MGYRLNDEELRHAFTRFKEIADRKKVVDERDIEAIVTGEVRRPATIYSLDHAAVTCGTHLVATAIVRLRAPGGALRTASAQGTGPVDAVCQAINEIVGGDTDVVELSVNSITEGLNAVGEVTIRLRERGAPAAGDAAQRIAATGDRRAKVFSGYGVHTDIIMATAEAHIAALNKWLHAKGEISSPPGQPVPPRPTGAREVQAG